MQQRAHLCAMSSGGEERGVWTEASASAGGGLGGGIFSLMAVGRGRGYGGYD
jgi:hypothetical protein